MATYLLFAFLGGVILNIMPCVLPVLTLKVFHTIEAFGDEKHNAKLHGLAYAGGTMFAFTILAIIVVVLRASGETLGWGMHFRHPPFVAALTALIFAFGLNALGVFEINISLRGSPAADGPIGSFFNGIFAAVMSTPCTAPFLGTAAGFAVAGDTPGWLTIVLFMLIGLGLAFPYTLVGFIPGFARLLPRPGHWMITFKHIMGFSLVGTAVWLYGALKSQISPEASTSFLGFLLALGIGLWAVGRFARLEHSSGRRWLVRAVSTAFVVAIAVSVVDLQPASAAQACGPADEPIVKEGRINWRPFDAARIAEAHAQGRPVFVDFTADWCAACKTNEKLFLETDTVRGALVTNGVLPFQADMTNENAVLDEWLRKLGRSGIPAYAIYLPDGTVDLLPVAITAPMVADRLRDAGERLKQATRGG